MQSHNILKRAETNNENSSSESPRRNESSIHGSRGTDENAFEVMLENIDSNRKEDFDNHQVLQELHENPEKAATFINLERKDSQIDEKGAEEDENGSEGDRYVNQ